MLLLPKDKMEKIFLTLLLLLVFIRSMNLGFGYPNVESMLGFASFLPQKIMQAIIFMSILIYLPLYFERVKSLKLVSATTVFLSVVIFLSLLFTEHKILTLRYILSFITPLFIVYVYLNNYGSKSLLSVLVTLVCSLVIINFIYIIIFPYYGIMGANHAGAFRGMFLHKNIYGAFCVYSSILFMFAYKTSGFKFKKAYVILYVLSFVGVLKCQSTTSLVLFLLAFLCFIFFYFFRFMLKDTLKVVCYFSFLITIIFLSVILSVFYEEITYALGKDPTLTGRTELWETLFYVAQSKPIYGHGLGLFQRPEIMHQYSLDFGWVAKSAHNSYLDLLLGIGWFGLLAFLKPLLEKIFIFPFVKHNSYRVFSCTVIVTTLCFSFSESGALMSTSFNWIILFISVVIFKFDTSFKFKLH